MYFVVLFTVEKLEHTHLKRLFDTNLCLCVQNAYFGGKQSRYPRLNIAYTEGISAYAKSTAFVQDAVL